MSLIQVSEIIHEVGSYHFRRHWNDKAVCDTDQHPAGRIYLYSRTDLASARSLVPLTSHYSSTLNLVEERKVPVASQPSSL